MWLLAVLLLSLPFGISAWIGAPYLPIMRHDAEPALDLLQLKAGQTIVDLGSGDGRLLRAAAKRGIYGIGYEINPFVYLVSLLVTWRYRRLIRVHLADFWRTPLPRTDAVYVFLIDRLMPKLDAKLTREIKHPTPVVSFVFPIPGQTAVRRNRNAWLYAYASAKPKLARSHQ
jgi:SAM-dependent methyltransferase